MPKKKQIRQPIWKEPTNNNGLYAVVRMPSGAKRAHFVCLHDTYESAETEAVRLLSMNVKNIPDRDHTFFVIQIIGHVSFIGSKFVGSSLGG